MKLALFDLDHTLLDGDSDDLWFRFLAERSAPGSERFSAERAYFSSDYHAGRLNVEDFYAFVLKPLAQNDMPQLLAWRAEFIARMIVPRISNTARALLAGHRNAGHRLVIITATHRFITEPIAAELGVDHLLATEPEYDGTRFTGRVSGVPCFREGKLIHLREWLRRENLAPLETWCYSDSHNDLALLESVSHPVAVNPDAVLARTAAERRWPVMRIRREPALATP